MAVKVLPRNEIDKKFTWNAESVFPSVEAWEKELKQILESGSSDYSLNVLKKAGVDMTSSKAVEETFTVMEGYIDRLEKLLG